MPRLLHTQECCMSPIRLILAACFVAASSVAVAAEPLDWAMANNAELQKLYQHFHAHPELSLMEKETGRKLGAELKAAGAEVTQNVGGHGVVGVLKNGAGKTVMLRADLDALPVEE